MTVAIALTHPLPAAFDRQETLIGFSLKHWCVWQSRNINSGNPWPGGKVLPHNGGLAEVSFLPMMQSRRLSPLARAACSVAWHSRQECGDMPAVFYSSHGESHYYLEMLEGLAGREEVSPSRFSLCVHNAIAGLSSFHSGSYQPYVCLAGGTEGLFAAFLEAGGMLMETAQVLLVWYEQALPAIYHADFVGSDATAAVAMVLSRAGDAGSQLRLSRRTNRGPFYAEDTVQSLAQAILAGQRSAVCHLNQSIWQWRLDDA